MKQNNYQAGRPNFLCQQPGLLDFLYTAWCKATAGMENLRGKKDVPVPPRTTSAFASQPTPLPSFVAFIDENIVCVTVAQNTLVVKPFCDAHTIPTNTLYVSVAREGHVGLKRDVFERILDTAVNSLITPQATELQTTSADTLLSNFDFMRKAQSQSRQNQCVVPKPAPYIL